MQHQQETEWCWDAVSVSIDHYFNTNSPLTQPAFATHELNVPLAEANQPRYIQFALQDLGRLESNPNGCLAFADIQKQLDANLPVVAHIEWDQGGAHYVLITGYQFSPTGAPQVLVADPLMASGSVLVWDYATFVYAYSPSHSQAEGYWVDTCLVHP
jgi:Papain-like cysteine protease AvrRpt2